MDHNHGGMTNNNMASPMMMKKRYTHMTFFWGKNSEILFKLWPGTSGGMYALALIIIFFVALSIEWLSHCRLIKRGAPKVQAGIARTFLYTLRTSLMYLMMLAIMSFNVGVLLVAVAGHAVGFLVFGSGIRDASGQIEKEPNTDLPPSKC